MADKKAKKPMTDEQLERLAEARKKANEMRKVNQAKRLQNKMDNLKYNGDGSLKESKEQLEPKEQLEEEQLEKKLLKEEPEVPEQEEPKVSEKEEPKVFEKEEVKEEEVIIKKKPKPKKKQVVIVEQSSSDSDEFEPNQSVLFVKRVTKKKEVKLPELPPQQYTQPPPERREPTPVPRKTKQELMYNEMFSGQFLTNQFGRRF